MPFEKIIIIGRQQDIVELTRPLADQIFSADNIDDAWDLIDSADPDMILIDTTIKQKHVCDFLITLNKQSVKIPVVVIQEAPDENRSGLLKDFGAFDCIQGEEDYQRLSNIIDRIKYPDRDEESEISDFFAEDCPASVSIVGTSKATEKSLKMIRMVAQSSCNPVLIVGETGTGKELAAKAVHILRHGTSAKFVAVNCAALTANLLESELFGHAKGSFTSADAEKTGLFEVAGNGTIFLDEISEMPLDLQAKLLRVLQEKTFRKVGGIEEIQCNATIITSSNRNLLKEVEKGDFRKDLYYRLSICPISLAPLRHSERKTDIPILAEYFLRTSKMGAEKKIKIKSFTKLALEMLKNQDWPGNVRELSNVIDRAIIMETTNKIGCTNLMFDPEHFAEPATPGQRAISAMNDFSLESAEKELIARALTEANGQKTRAAALLGITRATLYAKVKQYKIETPRLNVPIAV
jgi:DNA-binding NtrC family response regulator